MIRKMCLGAGKLALGLAALLWCAAPERAAAHGGGGGGHGGGGHGGGHGGFGGGHHGGFGYGGFGGYGLGGYGYGLGGYGLGGYGLGGYGLGGYGRYGYGGGYGGYGGGYGNGYYSNYSLYPPPVTPAPTDGSAHMTVYVPANAAVSFNGSKTQQQGAVRYFVSPPLEPGYKYQYEIQASWMSDGQPVSQTRTITVHPGDSLDINFVNPSPAPKVAPDLP